MPALVCGHDPVSKQTAPSPHGTPTKELVPRSVSNRICETIECEVITVQSMEVVTLEVGNEEIELGLVPHFVKIQGAAALPKSWPTGLTTCLHSCT